MNINRLLAVSPLLLATAALHAAPRTSAAYSILTDTADSAGTRASSANYTHDGSLGGLTGLSTVAAPTQFAKVGYIAQLYEIASLQIDATPGTINETGARQLSSRLLLDDATTLAVSASSVTWSVQTGPLTGIDANGLATAAPVFQDTLATARGAYNGTTGTLGLTVLDTTPDNFGTYAGDSLGDDWQVQYFGQNNPAAAPAMDPDGDSQNNLFEFTAGLIPTDRASVFTVNIAIPVGQPTQRNVVFSPRLAGRTYTVKTSTTLSGWTDLTAPAISDNGTERTVTDLNASGPRQFYRVLITRP